MAERRLRRGSVLSDLQSGARFGGTTAPWQPAPVENSGVGGVTSPTLSDGVATAIARSVQQIPFDDSIDGSYPLECFFQMPIGTVKVNSVKLWVARKPFRRYVSASSASSNSAGGSTPTSSNGGSAQSSSADTGHSHNLTYTGAVTETTSSPTGSGGGSETPGTGYDSAASAPATDAQGVHNHSDPDGPTGDAGSHAHNVNSHSHGHSHTVNSHSHSHSHTMGHMHAYQVGQTASGSGGSHSHTLDTTHNHTISVPAHSHTITTSLTPGIYEESLSGTVAVYVANDGTNFAGPVTSGQTVVNGLDLTSYFTKAPGDRRIRVNATALMRVQVLLVMDLLLDLGV